VLYTPMVVLYHICRQLAAFFEARMHCQGTLSTDFVLDTIVSGLPRFPDGVLKVWVLISMILSL
jgi:hypothetical protein